MEFTIIINKKNNMPAKSKAQQKLFGMALAVRRGELKRDDVDDEVLNIVDSDMTDKDIEDFASTKHKGLKEYIKESILDDEEVIFNDVGVKLEIEKFIKDNYKCKQFTISNKPNKDGKFVVDGTDILVTNNDITSLTNNLFIWGKVTGGFHCSFCSSLKSLEGAPEKVKGGFGCYGCDSLKSLEGAPKEVGGDFECASCYSLTSLKGAPKKCWDFYCHRCDSLKTLEGAPKEINGNFSCSQCNSLKSLEGAPKKVGGSFDCQRCDSLKTLEGAPKEVGGDFDCSRCNSLKSLDHLPKHIYGNLYVLSISLGNLVQKHIGSSTHVSGNVY